MEQREQQSKPAPIWVCLVAVGIAVLLGLAVYALITGGKDPSPAQAPVATQTVTDTGETAANTGETAANTGEITEAPVQNEAVTTQATQSTGETQAP